MGTSLEWVQYSLRPFSEVQGKEIGVAHAESQAHGPAGQGIEGATFPRQRMAGAVAAEQGRMVAGVVRQRGTVGIQDLNGDDTTGVGAGVDCGGRPGFQQAGDSHSLAVGAQRGSAVTAETHDAGGRWGQTGRWDGRWGQTVVSE